MKKSFTFIAIFALAGSATLRLSARDDKEKWPPAK
jgi:hypothetical protein